MKYIVANWKSNQNKQSTKDFFQRLFQLSNEQKRNQNNKVILAPPFNLLDLVENEIKEKKLAIELATQNLSSFEKGSYTGEVGPENLCCSDVKYAILGHSERRKYFSETCQIVAQKVRLALQFNLTPILCLDMPYLEEQALLFKNFDFSKIIIAYEPLEAIGTGLNQDPAIVEKQINKIKNFFPNSPVIYGGSVKTNNIIEYLKVSDGVLVGGASIQADSWFQLMNS
jgi:triosephosphate isomerase